MRNDAGISLVAAIIVVVVVGFLGVVTASLFGSKALGTANRLASAKAQFIAEGGLERGVREYKSICQTNPAGYDGGETNVALGGGTFSVQVYNNDFSGTALGAGQRRIRSTGSIAGAVKAVEQIVYCTSSSPLALASETQVSLSNNSSIYCGPGATNPCSQTQIDGGKCVCAKESVPTLPAVTVPTSPQPPAPPGGCSYSSNTTYTWPAGTYYCNYFAMSNGAKIAITGVVTLYANNLQMANSAEFNRYGTAANALIMVTQFAQLANSSVFRGSFYAPDASFQLANGSTIVGSVATHYAQLTNSAQIVWDYTGGTAASQFGNLYDVNVMWREVPP